jgi:glyoxylase-like metal-dependent hydrolase (beta-lactamase superfamily II)
MRVVRLTTGVVRGKHARHGGRRYLPGGWSADTLPVNAFAVEHTAGLCLFDTGQSAAAARPGHLPRWHPFLRLARFELGPEDEAPAQLRRAGLDPAATRWVVLSHLHTDHAGGIGMFPDAEVLVSATEWRRATGIGGRLRGYTPGHWPALEPTLLDLSGPPVGPFSGSHDLAGDGTLLVVPTPGHTPGHVSLLVDTGSRRYLLAGDLVHDPAALGDVAPAIASWCMAGDVTVLTAHDSADA